VSSSDASATPRRAALLGLLALAGCGDLPQPFRGQPGATAMRLARPPAYRIAVPAPTQALLTADDAEAYAKSLADALVAQEVPAVSGERFPLDWTLEIVAMRDGRSIVPRYVVRDADGLEIGDFSGRAVAAREWVEGGGEVHRAAATLAAPAIAGMVARADARRRTGDETAVGANPPAIRLIPVRGAPGDGNQSLTARMAERLAGIGLRVTETAAGAQFAVQGQVAVVNTSPGVQRVEIIWTVSRRDGYDLGRVLQLNEVPAGSLNGLWGDVAYVVAAEASGGVRDVIANAGGFGEQPPPPPAAESQPGPAPAPPVQRAAARPRRATP
jgi:hypothetical protein